MLSRISNPASRMDSPIRSWVRGAANASSHEPGFSTRYTSSQAPGGGTKASHPRPMNPLPSGTCSRSPASHAASACSVRLRGCSASPYGGSVQQASALASGSDPSTASMSVPNRATRPSSLAQLLATGNLPPGAAGAGLVADNRDTTEVTGHGRLDHGHGLVRLGVGELEYELVVHLHQQVLVECRVQPDHALAQDVPSPALAHQRRGDGVGVPRVGFHPA